MFRVFEIAVVKCEPAKQVCIINTDLQLELLPPLEEQPNPTVRLEPGISMSASVKMGDYCYFVAVVPEDHSAHTVRLEVLAESGYFSIFLFIY